MLETEDYVYVRECLQGHTEAFEKLVEKYQRPIFNTALRLVKDHEDAQDITQSVFLKAYEKLKSYKPKHKFYSWIYRIAVNTSLNHIYQQKNREEISETMRSAEKNPEEKYQEVELSERIQDALMQLSLDYRLIIILRHFEQMTYKEMSYILEIPEKTVKSRLYTARQLLAEILIKAGTVSNA